MIFDVTNTDAHSQVYRLYKAAFDRTPDLGGFVYWSGVSDKGMSITNISKGFEASPEFLGLYGANPSNEQFATALYKNVFDRPPDASGLQFWVDQLNKGLGRDVALVEFANSPENIQITGVNTSVGYLVA